jgi:hypothetical protein
MEGVWRGSHVDCVTNWNCLTYEVKKLALKGILLTACLPWLFIQRSL